jgi:putative heme-binding domain-containing protein
LRVNPDGTGLKVMAHNFRNSYEIIPDSYGNLWQNDNDDQVVTCRTTWVMEGGNAGYFSADGSRSWQGDQRPGQDIFTAHWHQDDPGVMPAGDRSGAGVPTGVTINESDALGKDYVGLLLSADAGRNIIFGYHPSPKQSGYELGKRENFISSLAYDNAAYVWNDTSLDAQKEKWFRPSDVTIGTDGAIYVADWYDAVVGGHQMKDSTGYGRIYRIAPKNRKLTTPQIDLNTIEGQLQAFKSPAINVRSQGFERLKAGGDASVDIVKPLLSDANPYIKARAIWLLAQLGEKGKAAVNKMLVDPDDQSRATAYRALRSTEKDILPYAKKMASDNSSFVRREVAISLRDLPYEKTKPLVVQLINKYDGEDRWYLETLGTVLPGHESDIYREVVKMFGEGKPAAQWNKQMTAFAWRLHPAEAAADLALRANDSSLTPRDRKAALTALAFINDKPAANAMLALLKSNKQDVSKAASYWLSFRQGNDWNKLLDWNKISLNTGYERKLAQMKVRQQIMLDEQQSADERKSQARQMAADSVGGQMLIGLAADKKLPAALLPYIQEKIFENPDATIRMQASTYFKRPGTDKTYAIADILKLEPDVAHGQALFTSRCGNCHKWGREGATIGPDLTTIGNKFNSPELLDAIINPSAAIVFGYEAWLVNTKDGQSIYGFLLSENKQAIVIKDIAGQKHIIDLQKITSRKRQQKSLMPDPTSNGLNEKDLADLVGFLKNMNEQK